MSKHVERNDALKINNKIAVERYKFAIQCLDDLMIIADLGCGMGYGTYLLKNVGHVVCGYDNSKEAIEYATKNYSGLYNVVDIEKHKIRGFDAIVCLETLCHLKDPKAFVDSLDKESEVIISAPIDPDPNDGYKFRRHNMSEKQFKGLFKGWKIIKEFRQKNYLTIYIKKDE